MIVHIKDTDLKLIFKEGLGLLVWVVIQGMGMAAKYFVRQSLVVMWLIGNVPFESLFFEKLS